MHDASKVIVIVSDMWILSTIRCRASVSLIIRKILVLVPAHVLPMHLQERPLAMVPCLCIRSFLLMVQSYNMAQLMNHIADIAHAITPSQVNFVLVILHISKPNDMTRSPVAVDHKDVVIASVGKVALHRTVALHGNVTWIPNFS